MTDEKENHDELYAPSFTGRFNYVQIKPGLYNVIFVPYEGTTYTVIAKELKFPDMDDLRFDLNGALIRMKKDLDIVDDRIQQEER